MAGGPLFDPLHLLSSPVLTWFSTAFPEPTAAQTQGWPAIASGELTRTLTPTGSGETLSRSSGGSIVWTRRCEPVEADALTRFLPRWRGVGLPRRSADLLVAVVGLAAVGGG